jgi:hypothetical protein
LQTFGDEMKDALGHGSNGYNNAASAVVPAHGTGIHNAVPTIEQFQKYRADRRETVHNLNEFYHGSPNEWAKGVIARARQEHTASIARQRSVT